MKLSLTKNGQTATKEIEVVNPKESYSYEKEEYRKPEYEDKLERKVVDLSFADMELTIKENSSDKETKQNLKTAKINYVYVLSEDYYRFSEIEELGPNGEELMPITEDDLVEAFKYLFEETIKEEPNKE